MINKGLMDKPLELEQVYNTVTGKYNYQLKPVTNKKGEAITIKKTGEIKYKRIGKEEPDDKYQLCHYNEGSGCSECNHEYYCIFDEDRTYLEEEITEYQNLIRNYDNIIDAYKRRNEIIYDPEFKTHYKINIIKNNNGKHTTSVEIVDDKKFILAVQSRRKDINKYLRDSLKERRIIQHTRR